MSVKLILLIILLLFLFFFLFPTMIMAGVIYCVLFYRRTPDKWKRQVSMPEDPECVKMFEEGAIWGNENEAFRKPVSVVSDGLKLAGEYFDFGHKKAVIIIAGRTETCIYSYYFAKPYKESGYNVLTIDNRAHGLSEGKVSSLGYKEYRDILKWGAMLHDEFGVEEIVLHGICIGASTALFAITNEACPDYFKGLITEGMYSTFKHSFDNHLREMKHSIFPFSLEVMLYAKLISGANGLTDGPIKRIEKLTRPALFLHSRKDQFSLPDASEKVYNLCKADCETVWFDKGLHSRIRINNPQTYDDAVKAFIKRF